MFFSNRMERTRDGSGYGKAVAVRAAGPSAASAAGAVGVVIRSISTSDARFPHTGAIRYTTTAPRIPALAISNPDADALVRQFESGKPVRLRIRSSSRDLPQARSANVVGEIPGTDLADEIVILGAHLDSWDPGVGALDDGAGVAIMMGVAKLINELDVKPRRTIRVVLFANEEFGTSGSLAYVAANEANVSRHVLGFEADFGAGPVWRLSSRVNPAQLPAVDQIFRALAPLKLVRGDNEARGGADLEGLSKLGMPILEPGLDGTDYFDVHHTANDTLAQVDPKALRQSLAAFATAVWLGRPVLRYVGSRGGGKASAPLRSGCRCHRRRDPSTLFGVDLLECQARRSSDSIQHRMARVFRQAETVSPFPGADAGVGRIGGRRQFRHGQSMALVRVLLLEREADAIVRAQLAGDHRQYVFQGRNSRVGMRRSLHACRAD